MFKTEVKLDSMKDVRDLCSPESDSVVNALRLDQSWPDRLPLDRLALLPEPWDFSNSSSEHNSSFLSCNSCI